MTDLESGSEVSRALETAVTTLREETELISGPAKTYSGLASKISRHLQAGSTPPLIRLSSGRTAPIIDPFRAWKPPSCHKDTAKGKKYPPLGALSCVFMA